MKKWIFAISVILLLGILIFILRSDEQDLGDNYYYLPRYEAIDIGFPGGGIIYKSTQKNVFSNIKIYGNVINVNTNEDYIVAIQNADTSYIATTHSTDAKKESLQYFIIQKKSDLVYGPYTKEKYLQKREELEVPKELQLKVE